jgi:hypothetical protein
MAAATGGDDSLEDFIEEYKPRWDGYLELRMYLGTKNAPVYSFHYPALAVKVTGATWHAVGGGPVNCRSGTAESLETMLLPKSATSPPTTVHPGGSGSPAGVASAASASRAISSRSSNHLVIAAVIVIVLAVLAALSLLIARRRRPAISPSIAVTTRSSTKGHRP